MLRPQNETALILVVVRAKRLGSPAERFTTLQTPGPACGRVMAFQHVCASSLFKIALTKGDYQA